jgi:hypothetical protein
MRTRRSLGADALGCSAETEWAGTREQEGCAGYIARTVPGQQSVTLRAVHRHKGGQQGGRHAYAGVLRPDVSQEKAVAGAGLQAARDRAAVRRHPREGGR